MSLLHTLNFIRNHPLNHTDKLGALLRFLKWQIGSRLVPGAIVYEWVNGAKFLVKNGEAGLTGNIYTGLHEFADMGFLLHFLRPNDLFVDVGANVGSYTLLASGAIGSRAIAFEPVPFTYSRLVDNMRLNHLDTQVECINKGVGAKEGSISFTRDEDTMNHVLAAGEVCANSINVDITTLDQALAHEAPALMKIDVEGFETPVIEGAQSILQKKSLNAVIMELNGNGSHYGFDESKIPLLMSELGFRTYAYDPMSRTLSEIQGKNPDTGNTLFIRDKALVQERLRSAPALTLHGTQF